MEMFLLISIGFILGSLVTGTILTIIDGYINSNNKFV